MTAIAITGFGVYCAGGRGVREFGGSLLAGRNGFTAELPIPTERYRCHMACPAPPPPQGQPHRRLPGRLRTEVFSLARAALAEAVASAHLTPDAVSAPDTCLIVATTLGHITRTAELVRWWATRGTDQRWPPSLLLTFPIHAVTHLLATEFGITGRTDTVTAACASGASAIVMAARLLQADGARRALVVGVEPMSEFAYAGFDSLMLLDPRGCRPLSGDGGGITLGSGAGALVLEPVEVAAGRGARTLALLAGMGMSCDAAHPTAPDPSGRGPVACLRAALAEAGASPVDVGYVNCHGTGTRLSDQVELAALGTVFPDGPALLLNSSKGLIGHTLGASGVIEAIATVLALGDQVAHPNRLLAPRRIGRLSLPVTPTPFASPVALSNSFGFGGFNVTLALARPDYPMPAALVHRREVTWLTGVGLVSALGTSAAAGWATMTAPGAGQPKAVGGLHAATLPPDGAAGKRRLDGLSSLAIAAAAEAAADAGLTPGPRVALVYGSGSGPIAEILSHLEDVHRQRLPTAAATISPTRFIHSLFSTAAGYVAIALGLTGPVITLASGGVTGLHALSCADALIGSGAADAALVVVADELSPPLVAGYGRLRLLSQRGVTLPFDRQRDGFVLGEAAAALVLEAPPHAAQRRRQPLAGFAGFGAATDCRRAFRPGVTGAGLQRAIEQCLSRAGLPPAGVGLILSGANAVPKGDQIESRAIAMALAGHRPLVTAPKSWVGETDGSWGIIAAVLATRVLDTGVAPPTAGVGQVDPSCGLNLVLGGTAACNGAILITARSLTGHNAAALLTREGG